MISILVMVALIVTMVVGDADDIHFDGVDGS